MRVCIIGVGYVGLTVGACLAQIGHQVICIDNNSEKIQQIQVGKIPIYEPKLDELIVNNLELGNLKFSTDYKIGLQDCDICYIAVGTPSKDNGDVDFSQVDSAIDNIAKNIKKYTVIINKSTVPIGSAQSMSEKIAKLTQVDFDIVSNPEFLKQGTAVDDFLKPERIVIGTKSHKAKEVILKLYEPLEISPDRIVITDENSAEMIKYASNSLLAVKISFMNEIANLCEKIGADIDEVKRGVGLDSRIGDKFLNAGIGFGGSCFPKDISAIINIAKNNNESLEIIEATKRVNQKQKDKFVEKILKKYDNNIKNKTFAVWGLTFKPNTNDLREAPSLYIIDKLKQLGAIIKAYDPKAICDIKNVKDKYEALIDADSLIIFTEWDEFKQPDFQKISSHLKDKIVFDGRNIYKSEQLKKYNLEYVCVGKNE